MTKETPKIASGQPRPRRLEGRVASILNAREIVINIGSNVGVVAGQKFAVLAAAPIEIRDPESQKLLDTVDREKVRVEATEVRPCITICRTYRMKGGMLEPAPSLHYLPSVVMSSLVDAAPETLRVEDASVPPALAEEESYVKINDRIVSVSRD